MRKSSRRSTRNAPRQKLPQRSFNSEKSSRNPLAGDTGAKAHSAEKPRRTCRKQGKTPSQTEIRAYRRRDRQTRNKERPWTTMTANPKGAKACIKRPVMRRPSGRFGRHRTPKLRSRTKVSAYAGAVGNIHKQPSAPVARHAPARAREIHKYDAEHRRALGQGRLGGQNNYTTDRPLADTTRRAQGRISNGRDAECEARFRIDPKWLVRKRIAILRYRANTNASATPPHKTPSTMRPPSSADAPPVPAGSALLRSDGTCSDACLAPGCRRGAPPRLGRLQSSQRTPLSSNVLSAGWCNS